MLPRPLLRCVSVLALLLAAAAPAAAQVIPLDDVWFKVSVKANGYAMNPATSVMNKAQMGTKAFLHLSFAAETGNAATAGATYDFELWTKQAGGTWAMSDSGQQKFMGIASGDQLAVDLPLTFQLADGRFIDGRGTYRFNIKLDKHGFLKKARLSTLGAETVDGSTNGTNVLAGKLSLDGHRVKAGQLPFEP